VIDLSFVRDIEEIKKRSAANYGLINKSDDFESAEMINVFWETKAEIVERLLPPPLEPTTFPLATALLGNYPKTNFGLPYLESALFIGCQYKGVIGMYCLAMHLDGPGKGLAMAGGRETVGFPKKLAKIELKKDIDNNAEGLIFQMND